MIRNKFGKPMEEGFDAWFYGQELYTMRAERFYDLLEQIKATSTQTPMLSKSVVEWLRAAYEQGKEDNE